jgi:acid phosphatase family membrane protein YuiD
MLRDLFTNWVLVAPACAWALAQLTKAIVALLQRKGLQFRLLFTSGGMPSAHSAAVSALATCIGFVSGLNSVVFAISVVLAFIVMYDAMNVRHSVGRQSAVINRIVEEIRLRRPMTELKSDLRELVGHTPFQVYAGGALGVAVAVIWAVILGV